MSLRIYNVSRFETPIIRIRRVLTARLAIGGLE
jgi:hypothetical protein